MENSSVSTLDLLNSTSESETENNENEKGVESTRLSSAASLNNKSTEVDEDNADDEIDNSGKLELVVVEEKVEENKNTSNDAKKEESSSSSINVEPLLGELEDVSDDIDTSDLDHLEPKLREAWIEMRRLDKKLAAVTKRAKKARLETLTMIESNKKEWENFKLASNYVESKLEAQITHKFYALSYPDLGDDEELFNEHRRGNDETNNNEEPHTPVFKTQAHFDDDLVKEDEQQAHLNRRKSKGSSKFDDAASKATSNHFTTKSESIYSDGTNGTKAAKSSVSDATNSSKTNNKDKDFIKRNIQLAKDNAGALAMTDEEKKRLKELLSNLMEPESAEESSKVKAIVADEKLTYMVDYQPHLVELEQGDGFTPTQEENEQLKRIDQQLQRKQSRLSSMIRLTNELERITYPTHITSDSDSQIAPQNNNVVEIRLNDEFNEDEFGDRFIREARMQREEELRLKYIDSKLKDISENQKMILRPPGDRDRDADSNIQSIMNEENRLSFAEESSINEGQIKQLIQEFYSEVGGLSEAENETVNEEAENGKIPVLSETQLRNLLEELGVGETVSRPESRSTVHSYYDEALKIISESRTKLKSEFIEDRQVDNDGDENEGENKNEENTDFCRDSNQLQLAQIISPLNNQETSEEAEIQSSQTPKLPPIYQDSSAKYNNSNNQRPASAVSNASRSSFADSTSSFSLPKINDRYLQK